MSQTLLVKPSGFADLALHPALLRALDEVGFTEPRPIQLQTIPAALARQDILGLAPTGTGKTAAFALPLIQRLLDEPRRDARGPRVLVLAPTRELARQIAEEINRLARFTRVRTSMAFGGVPLGPQIAGLRARPEVLVACPGRLLDLLTRRATRLDDVEAVVIDEADHMFDMGFLPDVTRIVAMTPASRHAMLFSATMPSEIRTLADRFLSTPHVVELAPSRPAETIEHALYGVDDAAKLPLLEHLMRGPGFVSGIVFTRTKHRAKRLAEQLDRSGFRAVALQGNMSQGQRDRAMQGFRSGRHDVLVATDIAARGLDVSQVSHVVNFDLPQTPDGYTHRVGRTGRSGRHGLACSFATRADLPMVRAIERQIGSSIPRCRVEGLTADLDAKVERGRFTRGPEGANKPGSPSAPRSPRQRSSFKRRRPR